METLAPLDVVDDRRNCPNCGEKLDRRYTDEGTLPILDCWNCGRKFWLFPDGQVIAGPTIARNPHLG